MQQWEYRYFIAGELRDRGIVEDAFEIMKLFADDVAKLGEEGWELVSAVPFLGTAGQMTVTKQVLLMFKRPKV